MGATGRKGHAIIKTETRKNRLSPGGPHFFQRTQHLSGGCTLHDRVEHVQRLGGGGVVNCTDHPVPLLRARQRRDRMPANCTPQEERAGIQRTVGSLKKNSGRWASLTEHHELPTLLGERGGLELADVGEHFWCSFCFSKFGAAQAICQPIMNLENHESRSQLSSGLN